MPPADQEHWLTQKTAGIGPIDSFVTDKLDSNGELLPPNMKCMDIGCTGFIYTCKLAVHHVRKNANGGSVVLTASGSSIMPFVATDYGVAKHAVLGLTRNLTANLAATNIRANCVAPLWTASGLVPAEVMKVITSTTTPVSTCSLLTNVMQEQMGIESQPPEAVGRSVTLLMVDEERRGQCIFSKRSTYREIESGMLGAVMEMVEADSRDMPTDAKGAETFAKMFSMATESGEQVGK